MHGQEPPCGAVTTATRARVRAGPHPQGGWQQMCGIAGWVDFGRDLTRDRNTLQAMTDTLACRGPDAEGLWLDTHAALTHRRLAVIDIEGGRQPMTAEDGGGVRAVLTYSGEAYNFRELRDELAARGHGFRTASDTEVVLRAYLEWGEEFASHLNGMFGLAIWDVAAEQLLLVRDRLGIKPLYYYPTARGVLFGSEPKAILANPLASAVVDADGLRELMTPFTKTPGHAVFRGMREVLPGELVCVRRSGLTARKYWRLEARAHSDGLKATVATIRALLENIVERQLIADVPLCSLLSGGLDSSAVTALSAKALREQGLGPVRSFAVDFAGHQERFVPDALRETPDAPYVADVVRHVQSDHTDIVLDSAVLMRPEHRAAVLGARDLPLSVGDMDTSLYLLFAAVRERSTVALSGESADEVFGGYAWFHDPRAVAADTFPWLAAFLAAGAVRGTLFQGALMQRLDLPTHLRDRYRDALAEVPRLEGETGLERRMREVSYLHLTRFLQTLLDRKDRMSMAVGLEVRVPLCDHRLVEYVFNTPWAMKTFDGREKALLRAATADLLPPSVLERRKSPYPSTQDPAYERSLRAALATMLNRGAQAPITALIDVEAARRAAAEPVGSSSSQFQRQRIEMVLQINAWLERYRVRIDL